MTTPIHQSIISRLTRDFITSTATLPANLQEQTEVVWGQKFNAFRNQWSKSQKVPGLGIQVYNIDKNKMELKWVLEVGLSETYKELKNDTRLWLEGWLQGSSQISMVTIVRFCETPRYHRPLPIFDETGEELDPREAAGIPSDFTAICEEDVILEGDYGPATYKGLRWVGQISDVWMETWVRDTHGKAIQRGNRIDLMHTNQVKLEFGDFLPPGYPQMIMVGLEAFRSTLQRSIQDLTVSRCRGALHDYLERHGEAQDDDPDYQP
jgi:hypothetical protein